MYFVSGVTLSGKSTYTYTKRVLSISMINGSDKKLGYPIASSKWNEPIFYSTKFRITEKTNVLNIMLSRKYLNGNNNKKYKITRIEISSLVFAFKRDRQRAKYAIWYDSYKLL